MVSMRKVKPGPRDFVRQTTIKINDNFYIFVPNKRV